MKLPKAGAAENTDTELAESQETRSFYCQGGEFSVTFSGAFDGNTVTMKHSPEGRGGTFQNFVVFDGMGNAYTQTFTTPGTIMFRGVGGSFKFVANAVGSPDVDINLFGNDPRNNLILDRL